MWAMIEKLRMWAWSATYLGYLSAPAHPRLDAGRGGRPPGHPGTCPRAPAPPRARSTARTIGQPLKPEANPSNQRPTPQTRGRPLKLSEPLERLGQQPQLLERAPPGHPHRQQSGEDRHGVDRLAPLLGPVVIAQVQPQRELVEGQRRGDPVQRGRRPRSPPRLRRMVADRPAIGPHVAHPQKPEDPEG